MDLFVNYYVGLSIVLLAIMSGLYNWKRVDVGGKVFFTSIVVYFMVQSFIEGCMLYKDIGTRFKTLFYIVRDVEPILDYALWVIFFHVSIDKFRQKKIAAYLIPAGFVLYTACMIIFRKAENSLIYFEPFACLTIIILSVFALNILHNEFEIKDLKKMPVFWFSILLLFFYGFFIFFSISYSYLIKSKKAELFAVFVIFRVADIFYIGAAVTYFLYHKKVKQLE